jgi:Mrp family chromosome partitioning ATPase
MWDLAHEHNCMSTKIVAVTINRGGQGKTMLCRSLGALAGQAGLAVLVADMDTQENSTAWRKRRPEARQLPLVEFTAALQALWEWLHAELRMIVGARVHKVA